MVNREEDDLRALQYEIGRRQRFPRNALKMGETIATLLARRGYAQVESTAALDQAWQKIIGEQLAKQSRTGLVKRGTLEIYVLNSSVLQELTFQKRQLLKKLTDLLPDFKIKDLKFRVGSIS